MANFDQLKQSVAALIRTNGAEEITGQIMQDVLLTIINSISGGYMFGGVAQHNGNVGNPDYNVFYLAGSGAYTGYGGAITIEAGCYGVFRYNGSWAQEVVDIGVRLSGSIVQGETRGVTGDVINTALQQLFNNVMDILDTLTFTYNTPSAQQATKAMIDVIMTPTGGASHVFATLTLASATVAAAGLMSAEDKQKVDRMLTDFRSLSLTDTTAAADQATKIVQTLSATLGENPEAITTFTLLVATASKAGLMSAADKSYLDSLPAVITGINGAISDNLARVLAMMGYYECSTAAGTAAKVVSASGYSLTSGGCIRVKMTNANTASNVTLNINSTGAKALYYDGVQASSTNTWEAGEVLEVYYDGTQYQCASGGGGGKFATGEKVQDVSITNSINANSNDLVKGGAIYSALGEKIDKKAIDKYLVSAGGVAEAKTVGNIVGVEVVVGDEVPVTATSGGAITNTNTVRGVSGFIYVHNLDVSSYDMLRVQCQPSGWSCLLAMDENYNILYTYTNISTLTDFDFNVASEGIKYLSISSRTTIAVHEITYIVGARIDDIDMKASESYNSLIGVTPTYISGKYLTSTGNTLNLAGSYVSDFIAIPNGLTSFLYKGHRVGSAVNAAFWSDRTQTAFASVQVDANSNDYQIITIPSGALYMKVCSTDSVPQLLMTLSAIVSYYMGYLNDYLIPNHLYGKVMVGLGDSEMAGQGQVPHCKLIADRNKMTFNNHATGGQHITRTASDDVLGTIESNADYVIVQIGYNDPQNPTYLNDTTSDDSTDVSTFKGAFNHIVEYVQTNHPTAKLGFILPRYYEDSTTTQNHEWHLATSMWMAKRAETLHIPFFDETAHSGMSYSITAQRQLYFQDYVHLSAAGFERVSYPIEQWLRGL